MGFGLPASAGKRIEQSQRPIRFAGLQSRVGLSQHVPRRSCAAVATAAARITAGSTLAASATASPHNLDRNALLQGLSIGCPGCHPISIIESGENGHLGQVDGSDGHRGSHQPVVDHLKDVGLAVL